jgi:hypothetical protein
MRSGDGTTAQRGYGYAHKALRARWAERIAHGGVSCTRCGLLILPGEPFDLGHDDYDRSRWTGPEHPRCNRGAPSRRRRGVRRVARFVSGKW